VGVRLAVSSDDSSVLIQKSGPCLGKDDADSYDEPVRSGPRCRVPMGRHWQPAGIYKIRHASGLIPASVIRQGQGGGVSLFKLLCIGR